MRPGAGIPKGNPVTAVDTSASLLAELDRQRGDFPIEIVNAG